MTLFLTNSLTRSKAAFTPIHPNRVGMYVCGPTVYERPHIGNARAVVVYDLLYRLLQRQYRQVTYVRNITDVDDKINAAAKANNEPISALTQRITAIFHENMEALHCLPPTHEPRATEHIDAMIAMIQRLIAHDCAYESAGHVYFAVSSYADYGKLAGRVQEHLIAGSRVELSEHKRNPNDFVLWKPANEGDDPSSIFSSPWGAGRPGWHIECSAMSETYLGADFDIHGGGADLMFPHHSNEIAQSCCANKNSHFAHVWVHNGFLTVNGEKMSKSLGNFITVSELLEQGINGETIRYVLLATHYRKPLDWTDKSVEDAKKALDSFYRALEKAPAVTNGAVDPRLLTALSDDLNSPEAISILHDLTRQLNKETSPEAQATLASTLTASGQFLGLLSSSPAAWLGSGNADAEIDALVAARIAAKQSRNFAEADRIRDQLKEQGILLEDKPGNISIWRRA
jgi:cysteinyl-tRNA synthetase